MKPTVHDLAEAAGVSLATIDRVLNGRSGVRDKTRNRVLEAMDRIGYVRDVAAANLARQRFYDFDFIVPVNDNAFMQALRAEIVAAQARGGFERTRIRLIDVPAFDEEALEGALASALQRKPDGVAFVAIDSDRIVTAVSSLRDEGIGAVTIVSDLAEQSRDHYVGIDNVAAGRSAASLLGRFLTGVDGTVAIMAGSLSVRDHRQRLDGFLAVMQSEFPALRVLSPLQGRDEAHTVERLLTKLMEERGDLLGLYSLGGGNDGLVRALSQARVPPRFVIAHELDVATKGALRDGTIDAVLAQDAGHEIRSAIRVLTAHADRTPIIAAQERIRIEIYLRDNLPQEQP
ncbi:MAG: LacI family transcriptional regulator [Shinella sp.]|nr:MAG: LacI family transcriptional regulator [Shinella sp.]